MSPSTADEQTTQDNTETSHNEGVYEAIIYRKKEGNNDYKNTLTFTKFSSAELLSTMAHAQQNSHCKNGAISPKNKTNLTKSSGRRVEDDVAVRKIAANPVLQWYFSWTRCCGGGGGNCHGAEVQYHIVRDFFYFISFTWNLVSFFTLGDVLPQCYGM
jgi:hypothetical protein